MIITISRNLTPTDDLTVRPGCLLPSPNESQKMDGWMGGWGCIHIIMLNATAHFPALGWSERSSICLNPPSSPVHNPELCFSGVLPTGHPCVKKKKKRKTSKPKASIEPKKTAYSASCKNSFSLLLTLMLCCLEGG